MLRFHVLVLMQCGIVSHATSRIDPNSRTEVTVDAAGGLSMVGRHWERADDLGNDDMAKVAVDAAGELLMVRRRDDEMKMKAQKALADASGDLSIVRQGEDDLGEGDMETEVQDRVLTLMPILMTAETTMISCGNHLRASCADCPWEALVWHGETWCNGVCHWSEPPGTSGTCEPECHNDQQCGVLYPGVKDICVTQACKECATTDDCDIKFPGVVNQCSSGFCNAVTCGGHTAASCADCPEGHGQSWCGGECEWVSGQCVHQTVSCDDAGYYQAHTCNECVFVNGTFMGPYFCNGDCEWIPCGDTCTVAQRATADGSCQIDPR